MKTISRAAIASACLLLQSTAASAAPSWNGAYDPIPGGSYQASCREITAFNGQLYARCVGPAGGLFDTNITYRNCSSGGIVNVNGNLQCGNGGGSGGGWNNGGGSSGGYGGGWNSGGGSSGGSGGGWSGGGTGPVGLIVYENPDYRGMRLEISSSVPDLTGSGLDDQITSVRVVSGTWQLCAGTDFNGQCWTVSADNPNLKAIGGNDKVSSIRRLPPPRR